MSTPITDEIRELAHDIHSTRMSMVFGSIEENTAQKIADFVAGREAALNEIKNLLATRLDACRENYQAQSIQADADRREIADWKRLYYHAIDHQEWALLGSIRKQLATAQQRIKELEEDEHRFKKLGWWRLVDYVLDPLGHAWEIENPVTGHKARYVGSTPAEAKYYAENGCAEHNAAMSREQKEGEAK